jgi:NitT/TauT family transport system substrate-binding protein
VATAELELMKAYVKPDGFNGALGEVDEARVDKIIKLLEEADQVKPAGTVKPADVVDDALAPKG